VQRTCFSIEPCPCEILTGAVEDRAAHEDDLDHDERDEMHADRVPTALECRSHPHLVESVADGRA
jgi:hypothetical protein